MLQLLATVAALFLSVALLMLASGLQGSLVGLRASFEGFPLEVIGLLLSAFYVGLIAGTRHCGALIRRVGHIRAFGAFCGLNAAAVLAFPLVLDPYVWLLLRVLVGFNMAGLYITVESWLNATSTGPNRGTLLAVYMAVSYLAMGGGQFLLGFGDIGESSLFMVAAMLTALALVPLTVSRSVQPVLADAPRFGFRRLYAISPQAVLGCLLAGTLFGALFGLGPVFGGKIGLATREIAEFMGVLVISGLVLQLPLGRLSDRVDRRWVIAAAAAVTAAASLALLLLILRYTGAAVGIDGVEFRQAWDSNPLPLLAVAGLCGGALATIYPLCVAHANDQLTAEEMLYASGGLVMAHGVGALAGPIAGGFAMKFFGPLALFAFTATVACVILVMTTWRLRRGTPVVEVAKEAFVVMPDASTTPLVHELDPRAAEEPTAGAAGEAPADVATVPPGAGAPDTAAGGEGDRSSRGEPPA